MTELLRINAKYFITSSTLGRYAYLKTDNAKIAILQYLTKSLESFGWKLEDWVVLDNHLHFMVTAPKDSKTLPKVINNFYRFSANWLTNNNIRKIKSKYFHNYWDTCITYENSYYARLNYIWFNPVKHGYVEYPEEWKFGSYFYRYKNEMQEMKTQREKYPFNQIKIEDSF